MYTTSQSLAPRCDMCLGASWRRDARERAMVSDFTIHAVGRQGSRMSKGRAARPGGGLSMALGAGALAMLGDGDKRRNRALRRPRRSLGATWAASRSG